MDRRKFSMLIGAAVAGAAGPKLFAGNQKPSGHLAQANPDRKSSQFISDREEVGTMNVGMLESVSLELGGRLVVFHRHLNHPIDDVWAALTDPAKLGKWYANTDKRPAPGEQVVLNFENSHTKVVTTVTNMRAPHVFEYTWDMQAPQVEKVSVTSAEKCPGNLALGGTLIRWELTPKGERDTSLTLSHFMGNTSRNASGYLLAGWHGHLDTLADGLGDGFTGANIRWASSQRSLPEDFEQNCKLLTHKYRQALGA